MMQIRYGWPRISTLAESEEAAKQIILEFQSRCYHLPATVQQILASEESYTDVTGPVWQGARYSVDDETDDEIDGEYSGDDETESDESF